jgi:hypothetical protein
MWIFLVVPCICGALAGFVQIYHSKMVEKFRELASAA